jgi:hypothetical protein
MGESFARREPRPRVGDDRAPADVARCCAQRIGRVHGAVDQHPRRRAEDIREQAPSVQLDHLAVTGADQLVGDVVVPIGHEPFAAVVQVDEEDGTALLPRDVRELLQERGVGLVDPDVDLPAAGEPDAERLVVGNPVREQPGLTAGEHLASRLDDLALHAAAGDRPRELAPLGDDQLRPDRSRSRAPGGDDTRHGDPVTLRPPAFQLGQDLPHRGRS